MARTFLGLQGLVVSCVCFAGAACPLQAIQLDACAATLRTCMPPLLQCCTPLHGHMPPIHTQVFLKVTEESTDYGVRGEVESEMACVSRSRGGGADSDAAAASAGAAVAAQAGAVAQPVAGFEQAGASCKQAQEQQPGDAGQPAGSRANGQGGEPGGGTQAPASEAAAVAAAGPVTGVALLKQQLRALLTKRALCAARGRLTLLTQLVVPLLLVGWSRWRPGLCDVRRSRGLALGRNVCLRPC